MQIITILGKLRATKSKDKYIQGSYTMKNRMNEYTTKHQVLLDPQADVSNLESACILLHSE